MHLHCLRKMRQRYIWEHTRFFITSIHYTMRQLHSIAIRLAIQTAFCTFVFQLSKKETALYLRAISVFLLHFAHLYFSLHYIRLHYTDLRSRSTEPASSPVLHILVPAYKASPPETITNASIFSRTVIDGWMQSWPEACLTDVHLDEL